MNSSAIDCIDVNHYNGISSVVDHLAEAGHKRIGFYARGYAIVFLFREVEVVD